MPQDDALASVRAFNSRLGAVRLPATSRAAQKPSQDALGRWLEAVLPGPHPRAAFSVSSEGEAFHSDTMRTNIRRGVRAISANEAALIRSLHRIALWKERCTLFYAITYWSLWWIDLLGPALVALILVRLLQPTLFDAPVFAPFKLRGDPTAPVEAADGVSAEVEDALGASEAAAETVAPASPAKAAEPTLSGKPAEPTLRTKIAQYGLPVQRALGNWADLHERFANLFNRRGTPDSARYRWAAIFLGLLLLLTLIPTRLLIRGSTAALGVHFFALVPLSYRYPPLHNLLDPENLLRDMPTDAQLAIRTLRADPSLIEKLGQPEVPVDPAAKTTHKDRFASLVRLGMQVTERGSEYFSREPPPEDGTPAAFSFFGAYGLQLGHLLVLPRKGDDPARIAFRTGVTIRGKPRRELLSLPIWSIASMRKTKYTNVAGINVELGSIGLDGVGDGLEIVDVDGTTHSFGRVYRRDMAFLRILTVDELPWQLA